MRVLVTGAKGFIGGHLCERLGQLGYEAVPYLSRLSDILDEKVLTDSLEGIDAVFHLAALAGVRSSVLEPLKVHEVNATGTLMVLEACRAKGIKQVIYSSSSTVYGNSLPLPWTEGNICYPLSPYSASKLAAEHYCGVYSALHGFKIASLRYCTVYGQRMHSDLALSMFVKYALKNESITLYGDGEQARDFIHVSDVVTANVKALESEAMGTYNIGGGESITMNELLGMILKLTESKSKVEHLEARLGDMAHALVAITKAKDKLGWKPQVKLGDGLREYVEWVKSTTF